MIKISYKENRLILENLDKTFGIYLNNKILLTQNTFINIGDQINIYGLKIIFLKGQMLINCPNERLMITENTANISKCVIDVSSELKNLELEEQTLYRKEDYYSKSPRIRRYIETKIIKLSPPPKNDTNHELPIILTVGPMMTMGIMTFLVLLMDFPVIQVPALINMYLQ